MTNAEPMCIYGYELKAFSLAYTQILPRFEIARFVVASVTA